MNVCRGRLPKEASRRSHCLKEEEEEEEEEAASL